MSDRAFGTKGPSGGGDDTAVLFPLDVAYAEVGIRPPAARRIAPVDIPDAYRALLVHEGNMTATLERRFGGRLALRLLSSMQHDAWFLRRVLLVHQPSGRPVAMAAVSMRVDGFSAPIRSKILRGEIPLGRVLDAGRVEYASRPRAFLSVTPNRDMMHAFRMQERCALYGRQTELFCFGSKIGDIVEVLALA